MAVQANEEYLKAKKAGEKAFRKAEAEGRDPYLPVLDDFADDCTPVSVHIGVTEIPLDLVCGTKTAGRYHAFASNFMPLMESGSEFACKWAGVYSWQLSEGISEAVKVFEYRRGFYVQEGNKRVSVMKYLESPVIQADVTRIMPLEPDETYLAFLDFYKVCPLYEFGFTKAESYEKLAEILGKNLTEKWDKLFVSKLKGAFYRFCTAYRRQEESMEGLNVSDAYLTFLSVYGFENTCYSSLEKLSAMIRQLRSEMLTRDSGQIAFAEIPEQKKSIITDLRKLVPIYTEARPLRICFLYDRDCSSSAWDSEHEEGRISLQNRYPKTVKTCCMENVPDGEKLKDALEKAALENDVIFTVSPMQMNETMNVAARYPSVCFMNCSVRLSSQAVRTYYVRMYEVKFLMGMAAAAMCENHKICYIADYPIYGSAAAVNAFAAGAAMIDPKAKIYLGWSGVNDRDWYHLLQYMDISVFCAPDFADARSESDVSGLYLRDENGKDIRLAVPKVNWTRYYELLTERIMNGEFSRKSGPDQKTAVNYWWGMNAGVIDIEFSGAVPSSLKRLTAQFREDIISGSFHIFADEIRDQYGNIRHTEGILSEMNITDMDWLYENVIGVIPEYERLSEGGRKLVSVSGIASVKGKR